MAYVDQMVVFDADSHVMELPDCLEEFADEETRERLKPLNLGAAGAMAGAELLLFSSDYPEGTKDPVARFEATMPEADDATRERFYAGNFRDLYRGAVPV